MQTMNRPKTRGLVAGWTLANRKATTQAHKGTTEQEVKRLLIEQRDLLRRSLAQSNELVRLLEQRRFNRAAGLNTAAFKAAQTRKAGGK